MIAGNAAAGALSDFPRQAGAVSGLFGAIQYGGGILGSALVGILADGTAWPMGLVVAVGGLGTLSCAWSLSFRQGRETTATPSSGLEGDRESPRPRAAI